MTIETVSDPVSTALTALIERVLPSVVQVRSRGRGVGTGVIWRTDGGIVTNQHVVGSVGTTHEVLLSDGRIFEATVATGSPELDLALLTVQANGLPAATVGDSTRLRVGELVCAIGNPWGQRGVVTAGIVSGLGTLTMRGEHKATYIRSDVRLAPGNSGGPLLNAEGDVVGIAAMIFGGDLAVAIPSQVAIDWVAGLPSRRATIGVAVQQVELPLAARQGALSTRTAGLLVVSLAPGGRAELGGLLVGDVLLEAASMPLEGVPALQQALAQQEASSLRFQILRGGSTQELEVPVGPEV